MEAKKRALKSLRSEANLNLYYFLWTKYQNEKFKLNFKLNSVLPRISKIQNLVLIDQKQPKYTIQTTLATFCLHTVKFKVIHTSASLSHVVVVVVCVNSKQLLLSTHIRPDESYQYLYFNFLGHFTFKFREDGFFIFPQFYPQNLRYHSVYIILTSNTLNLKDVVKLYLLCFF